MPITRTPVPKGELYLFARKRMYSYLYRKTNNNSAIYTGTKIAYEVFLSKGYHVISAISLAVIAEIVQIPP